MNKDTVITKPSVKDKRKAMQSVADALMATHNLRVVHVRKQDYSKDPAIATRGGCTVVYSRASAIDRMIAVAVAVVNDKDSYCRYMGRYLASSRFDEGERIMLRVPKNMKTSDFIHHTFNSMVNE